MNVIGICDITLICDALDHAEALLQTFGKFIGGTLQGCAIQRVVDIFRLFPLRSVFVELAHDFETKFLALRLGQLLPVEGTNTFPQSCIAKT